MSTKWKYQLKEWLTFSKKERIGFIVLLVVVLFVIAYPLVAIKSNDNKQLGFEEFAKQIDRVEAASKPENSGATLFPFDPNTADSATFLKLGFSPQQVKSIFSYRNTGAWFSKPDDFSKLYVVSEEQLQQVKPYIAIKQPKKPFKKVELNTADTTELQRLRGIGSYYARQIVRYREYLGGFYNVEQLKEIKGIDSERFSLFAEQYILNVKLVKLLNVNTADENRLKSHPYIGRELAQKIVEYRQTITISSIEQLIEANILTPDKAGKLLPYLYFQ